MGDGGLTISGTLIGAGVGVLSARYSLRVALVQVESQEREAGRVRLIDAARELTRCSSELNLRMQPWVDGDPDPETERAEDVRALFVPFLEAASMAELLFGPTSEPGEAAKSARMSMTNAWNHIVKGFGASAGDERDKELGARRRNTRPVWTRLERLCG